MQSYLQAVRLAFLYSCNLHFSNGPPITRIKERARLTIPDMAALNEATYRRITPVPRFRPEFIHLCHLSKRLLSACRPRRMTHEACLIDKHSGDSHKPFLQISRSSLLTVQEAVDLGPILNSSHHAFGSRKCARRTNLLAERPRS